MQYDFQTAAIGLTGDALKDETGKDITFKVVALNALLGQYDDERSLSGEEKLKRYRLAGRISKAEGAIELTIEEAALLKQLVGKAYGSLLYGLVHDFLEGKAF